MQTNNVQLRVTLSPELQTFLQRKAAKFGLNMSSYVKNLILDDIKQLDLPSHEASDQTIAAYKQALRNRAQATKVTDIGQFLDEL